METLHTWWATELYPMRERDQFGVSGEFEVVLAADAQVTIAALQAQLEAHERAYQEGHPTPCTLGSYCPYCEIERRVAQLTQRTVELEAVNKHCEIIEERKAEAYKEVEIQLLAKANLQAELARVRGERDEANELVAALSSKVAEYEVELNGDPQNFYGRGRTVGLRTLILALPQMEGQWEILEGRNCGETVWIVGDGGMFFEKDAAIAHDALLKHRQGMEG